MYAGVRIDQDPLRGESLGAVAGDCITVIKMAMFTCLELDVPVVVEARGNEAIRGAYPGEIMPRRTRYQQGSVQREKRQSGADVWVFRWWESTFDGTSKRRKAIVGTVEAFPTEASALKAAKALRIDANQQTPHFDGGPDTVAELVAH